MICTICHATAQPRFTALVLEKYTVQYYRCSGCGFIFTESPYWLAEAYTEPITRLDVGLVYRNEQMAGVTQAVIQTWFDSRKKFIDYGGGYGMLVRMMRDRGFDFYRYDEHCDNLFANSFDLTDVPPFRAELLTAFEVLEHLPDPVAGLETMLGLSDTILFSTMTQPDADVTPATWWYVNPHAGQHVSLFSRDALQTLAGRFGLHYVGNKQHVHLLSRKPIANAVFQLITHPRLNGLVNQIRKHPPTLLQADFNKLAAQIPHQAQQ